MDLFNKKNFVGVNTNTNELKIGYLSIDIAAKTATITTKNGIRWDVLLESVGINTGTCDIIGEPIFEFDEIEVSYKELIENSFKAEFRKVEKKGYVVLEDGCFVVKIHEHELNNDGVEKHTFLLSSEIEQYSDIEEIEFEIIGHKGLK